MFGMGGTEIIVILIVALLFLGPDKLPEAAKQISKGIRDIKKQSRVLQRTIEDDEHIGGAIRDLKSALNGDDEPVRPRAIKAKQVAAAVATATTAALPEPEAAPAAPDLHHPADVGPPGDVAHAVAVAEHAPVTVSEGEHPAAEAPAEAAEPKISLPPTAGEHDDDHRKTPEQMAAEAAELAALIRPAANTIARSAPAPAVTPAATGTDPEAPAAATSDTSEPKHG